MKLYQLANNRIQVVKEAKARKGARQFYTPKGWQRIAKDLPLSQLVEVWNHLPGTAKRKRFPSRRVAIGCIWDQLMSYAPVRGKFRSGRSAQRKAGGPKSQPAITRSDQILALLQTDGGASIEQLARATGWQKHSIRGFLSGVIRKKMGINVESSTAGGTRLYQIRMQP
jgi:hypothetical protein